MISKSPGSWLSFQYKAQFPSCWVVLKSGQMVICYHWHVTLRAQLCVSCRVVGAVMVHRWCSWVRLELLPSLGSWRSVSETIEAGVQERGFQVSSNSKSSQPLLSSAIDAPSTPKRQPRDALVIYIVLGVTWTTLTNRCKSFSCLVLGFY